MPWFSTVATKQTNAQKLVCCVRGVKRGCRPGLATEIDGKGHEWLHTRDTSYESVWLSLDQGLSFGQLVHSAYYFVNSRCVSD
jgi:hypothetical protein